MTAAQGPSPHRLAESLLEAPGVCYAGFRHPDLCKPAYPFSCSPGSPCLCSFLQRTGMKLGVPSGSRLGRQEPGARGQGCGQIGRVGGREHQVSGFSQQSILGRSAPASGVAGRGILPDRLRCCGHTCHRAHSQCPWLRFLTPLCPPPSMHSHFLGRTGLVSTAWECAWLRLGPLA